MLAYQCNISVQNLELKRLRDLSVLCWLLLVIARAYHELLQGQGYANESLAHS